MSMRECVCVHVCVCMRVCVHVFSLPGTTYVQVLPNVERQLPKDGTILLCVILCIISKIIIMHTLRTA